MFVCNIFLQAIAQVSIKLDPLLEGCKKNRQNWLHLAEQKNKQLVDECGKENESKDDNETNSKTKDNESPAKETTHSEKPGNCLTRELTPT